MAGSSNTGTEWHLETTKIALSFSFAKKPHLYLMWEGGPRPIRLSANRTPGKWGPTSGAYVIRNRHDVTEMLYSHWWYFPYIQLRSKLVEESLISPSD